MKLIFTPTSMPDHFQCAPDAEFVATFSAAVDAIALQPLPAGIEREPWPEYVKTRVKVSTSGDHGRNPIYMSHELVKDPAFESCVVTTASRRIGRVLQSHGILGSLTELIVYRTDLEQEVQLVLIATFEALHRLPAALVSTS